jgi:hypothetical protein
MKAITDAIWLVIPRRQILAGQCMPRGYRMAFYDPRLQVGYACPIGIHWIVRFFRRCWEHSFAYTESRFERLLYEARNEQWQEVSRLMTECDHWKKLAQENQKYAPKPITYGQLAQVVGYYEKPAEGPNENPPQH